MLVNNKTELNVKDISHFLQWNTFVKFREIERCNRCIETYIKLEDFELMNIELHSIISHCEKYFQSYALIENFRKYCGLKKPLVKVEEQAERVRTLYKHYSEIVSEN